MIESLSLVSIALVLWAGVVSFASPCFLPVVPVFAGYLTGQVHPTEAVASNGSSTTPTSGLNRRVAVVQSLLFMVGFTVVFVALWSLVGLIGWAVGDYRSWLRVGGGIILVVLGLHTAGLITIPALDRVLRVNYAPDAQAAPSLRRSFLLGLAFGAGWTPCIGPVLGGVLGLATTSDSVVAGTVLLLVYALGLGIPFVLLCAGLTTLATRLQWFTSHQRVVNWVSGGFLVLVGFLMITDLMSRLAGLLPALI